jgi:hypothetical protein
MLRSSASVKRVYQFKIQLLDISPPIWRRIQVPETYNFWGLHVAIQDTMGWWDYHLHVFRLKGKHAHKVRFIGIPDEDRFEDEPEIKASWKVEIENVFYEVGLVFEYEYDFGDGWVHEITHEGILIQESGVKYPRCVDGARACPREDCGGPPGYEHLLEVLSNPNHIEYDEMRMWAGEDYDPERFNPVGVKFENPTIRLRNLFR